MEIFFWGSRGSIASPGPTTMRYGGNTTCVEIRDGNNFILVDAGTGIREAGLSIMKNRGVGLEIPILITHTHWDHIQGFPFFVPAFIPKNIIRMTGPTMFDTPFDEIVSNQMQYSYFPVNFNQLCAQINYQSIHEEPFEVSGFKVIPKYINHPVRTLAYRFEKNDKVIVFVTDMEPYYDVIFNGICPTDDEEIEEFHEIQKTVDEQNEGIVEFCKGADVLVLDAQYTEKEYQTKKGWGHTSMESAIMIAHKAGARDLIFFHHDPTRNDEDLTKLIDIYREEVAKLPNTTIKNLWAAEEKRSFVA